MSKQTKITKSARGRECEIRSPVCNGDPETTVLCHLSGGGMGAKRSDIHAAYGCSACHDYVDNRTWLSNHPHEVTMKKIWFYEGVFRTQAIMLREGLIQIN